MRDQGFVLGVFGLGLSEGLKICRFRAGFGSWLLKAQEKDPRNPGTCSLYIIVYQNGNICKVRGMGGSILGKGVT